MKKVLQQEVSQIFNDLDINFLSHGMTGDLTVKNGKNTHRTCFQYGVYDDEDRKLFTIKVYDKVLELISRNGKNLVGSKCATIVGSKKKVNCFSRKLQACSNTGMTRLEMSIHEDALWHYNM